eukprot:Em0001g3202a
MELPLRAGTNRRTALSGSEGLELSGADCGDERSDYELQRARSIRLNKEFLHSQQMIANVVDEADAVLVTKKWWSRSHATKPSLNSVVSAIDDAGFQGQRRTMDNQPPPQQAVAVVMDNRGRSYFGNTNTFTSGGNYPGNWLMCPITFLLLSSIVPLWYVGRDDLELVKQQQLYRRMGHADAIIIIKHGGDIVKLTVRRLPESLSGSTRNGTKILTQCSVAHTALFLCGMWEEMVWGGDDGYGEEMMTWSWSSNSSCDDEDILHIEIHRDGTGFGFSIRRGAEYNAPGPPLRTENGPRGEGGAAERDWRMRVGDELLEINGNSTEGMGHADAITIIKHGGDIIKLTVSRLPESLSGRRYYCHDNL